jgi:hypothetical protein
MRCVRRTQRKVLLWIAFMFVPLSISTVVITILIVVAETAVLKKFVIPHKMALGILRGFVFGYLVPPRADVW